MYCRTEQLPWVRMRATLSTKDMIAVEPARLFLIKMGCLRKPVEKPWYPLFSPIEITY